MENENKKPWNHGDRPRGKRIAVWVNDDEKAEIEKRAKSAGMSSSQFLKSVGLNLPIRSVVDLGAVAELAKVNGDLGRVAGLLKLWLAEKRGQGANPIEVEVMMDDFRSLQSQVLNLMGKIYNDR